MSNPAVANPAVLPVYRLYAIRYATREAMRASHFMGGDSHDGPMAMDYFVWVAIGEVDTVVIDIGFTAEAAAKRKRALLCDPIQALRLLDVDPAQVRDVVLTHLHYDHAGNLPGLPAARFHVQEPEMHFAAGRNMKYRYFSSGYDPRDIAQAVLLNFEGRMVQHDGRVEILPGICLVPTPGHSPGQQSVLVHTARGWVLLASDASHYYENMERRRPHVSAHHVDVMLQTFDRLFDLGKDIEHIIPGHDPLVMQIYPAPRPDLQGRVARLDVAPAPLPDAPWRSRSNPRGH